MLCSQIQVVSLGGAALLPVDGIAGRILKAFQLAAGFSEHRGIEFLADHPLTPLVLFQQGRS